MPLRGQQFSADGTFNVPANVSLVWITQTGAGGGGGQSNSTYSSGSAGGCSGELCFGHPVHVTPGGAMSVVVGVGGISVSGANEGSPGSATSFGTVSCAAGQGGHSAQQATPSLISGAGGGVGGGALGATPNNTPGANGRAESPTFFGGSTGGGMPSAGDTTLHGADVAGNFGGPQGANIPPGVVTMYGGAGGSSSPYGPGATGGHGYISGAPTTANGLPASSPGSGGGGAGATQIVGFAIGGTGANGYCLVQWVE